MVRIRFMVLAVAAALASSAIAAGSAAALEAQLGRCKVNAGTGTKYEDSACLKVNTGKGSFEWKELQGEERKFTIKVGAILISSEHGGFACTEAASTGETEGFTKSKTTIPLKGCNLTGAKCKSEGAANAGEIVFETSGKLVSYVDSKGKLRVGLLLEPASAKIQCGEVKMELKGSVIAKLTSAESQPTEQLNYALNVDSKTGKQEIPDAANPLELKVGGEAYESATFKGEFSLLFKEISVVVMEM